jgi:hypothetical protein
MGNLRRWSSSASGNSSVAGGANTINFAEGQTPGSVNNSAREVMAQVRGIYTPSEWGWVEFSATASVASQTTIKLTGNQTSDWTAGRRWRLKSGSTTRYGSVVSSSFTAETTITVTVDSGSLSASHSLAALSPLDATANQLPAIRYNSIGDSVGIGRIPSAGYKLQTSGTIGANDGTVEVFMAPVAASSASIIGNVSNHAVVVYQNNAEAFRVDTNKNVLVTSSGGLGYGTGSGGAVTQLTSKSTGVTLNKTNGQVITHNAALAANTTVGFNITNSTVVASDAVILNMVGGGSIQDYQLWAQPGSGTITVYIKNITAGSLSQALTLNFAIIKAVTS